MAKPSTLPDWATDATYNSAGDAWDTDPTKVQPSAGKRAEGWEPTEKPAAEFLNWFQNLAYQWTSWLDSLFDSNGEHIYPTPRARVRHVSPFALHQFDGKWRVLALGPGYFLESNTDLAEIFLPLSTILPHGSTLTRVRGLVDPGSTEGSAGDGVQMKIFRTDIEDLANPAGATLNHVEEATDETLVASRVWLDTGVISLTMNKELFSYGATSGSRDHYLYFRASLDGGTNRDRIQLIELSYTDPGLQNI